MIVDLTFSEDQQLITDSVGSLIAERLPIDRLRDAEAGGARAEVAAWRAFAGVGLFGLGVAEARGGVGYGAAEEAIAALALGRALASPAVLAQVVAGHIADDESRPAFLSGASRAAFANLVSADQVQLIDGVGATHAVLMGDGVALVAIDALVDRHPVAALDDSVEIERARIACPLPVRDTNADRASLLIAAYLSGIAAATRDMAVDYARTREQFGQPIGAFQAIKHSCADMAVRAAAAEAQCYYAAVTFAALDDPTKEVAIARLLATDAALDNARANIQVHGGMGYTAECDAHLFLKRAHVLAALGGGRRAEQRRIVSA
jgi:alkylation response protein AidB-like acyl-CoA dehydrogenase